MLVLGLAGLQGTGKDTVADYLVKRYGFTKFAWSDGLYSEVQEAFGLEDQSLLRDRKTKEMRSDELTLERCKDIDFIGLFAQSPSSLPPIAPNEALSPRQILQWWGTDYRRAQDEDYWVMKSAEWLANMRGTGLPEHRPNYFVECGTRFENERQQIVGHWGGNIWHIQRAGVVDTTGHVSAKPLPVRLHERVLHNNDTIQRLHYGIDLLLKTAAPVVRVEPMLSHEELMNEYALATAQHSNTGEMNDTI